MKNRLLLNNQTIYQVFVRNYSEEGTFKEITKDLDRIKDLGVDILYLLPIHPIGELQRKGTWGSPYAIKDYFAISPDLGTLEDFKELVRETHKRGLKIILDMVFNHTSPDSVMLDIDEDFYFYKNGKRGNKVGDWSDIIDLDTSKKKTQDYLINVLRYWVDQGVDGFRFDVASMIQLSFFKRARKELGQDLIFLAESIDTKFYEYLKNNDIYAASDIELYDAFDIEYNYNTFNELSDYLQGKINTLEEYKRVLKLQEDTFPKDYVKTTCLENHDRERIASYFKSDAPLKSIIAYSFFYKGSPFIYAGMEYKATHKPELFEKDPISRKLDDQDFYNFIKRLVFIKKDKIFSNPVDFKLLESSNDTMYVSFLSENREVFGLFNFVEEKRMFSIKNGEYLDLISNKKLLVTKNSLEVTEPLFLIKQ